MQGWGVDPQSRARTGSYSEDARVVRLVWRTAETGRPLKCACPVTLQRTFKRPLLPACLVLARLGIVQVAPGEYVMAAIKAVWQVRRGSLPLGCALPLNRIRVQVENGGLWREYRSSQEEILRSMLEASRATQSDTSERAAAPNAEASTPFDEATSAKLDSYAKARALSPLLSAAADTVGWVRNKSLLQVANEKMLFHAIDPSLVDTISIHGVRATVPSLADEYACGIILSDLWSVADLRAACAKDSNLRFLLVVRATLGRHLRFTRASVPAGGGARRWDEDEVWRGGQLCPTDVVVSMPDAVEREFLMWDATRCFPEYVVAYSLVRQAFPQAPQGGSGSDDSGWRSTALGYDTRDQLYNPPASPGGDGMPLFEPMPTLPKPGSELPPFHDGQAELKPWLPVQLETLSADARECAATEVNPAEQEQNAGATLAMEPRRLAELLEEMRRKHAAEILHAPASVTTQTEEAVMYSSGMMSIGTSGLYRSNARMREKFPSGRSTENTHFADL